MVDDGLPPGGPPPHVEGITSDMHDVHNAIWSAAVETTRMPMIMTDPRLPDNPIVYANPAFLNMSGYTSDEIIGHNCRFLQGPETDREVVAQVRKAIEKEEWIAVEILNYKKNGSTFWNALFISPVYNSAGKLTNFFASQLDVTHKRDTNEALRQSQKMEAVGHLTGGIAHDFNNLLTVIQGYADLLDAYVGAESIPTTKVKKAVNAISQATRQGSTLTSQLLAFARKQKLEGRVVNVRDLVEKLIPLIERSVGAGVHIEVNHLNDSCNARLDTVQAETAILNIAANARDAMDGSGLLTITTGSREITSPDVIFGNIASGHYTYISIKDNGLGMDPETLEKITVPFFTTKAEGKGTGLGMSMVYGFVQQSGGAMAVESQIGKGTTVHMLFKLEQAETEPKLVVAEKKHEGRKGKRETILLVEDKTQLADFAEDVLLDYGYSVLRASNGDDALELFIKADKVDLLFSDIVMPGSMNGVHLAREILKRKPSTKVLLTTGYTDESVNIADVHNTPFDLMRKPYRLVELVDRIRLAIDGPDGIS